MSRSRRSSTQKELEEHTDGEPPRMIYHGTKQFWRQRTQLDLHIYQCAKQFTVVPFHKERHEEFESLKPGATPYKQLEIVFNDKARAGYC